MHIHCLFRIIRLLFLLEYLPPVIDLVLYVQSESIDPYHFLHFLNKPSSCVNFSLSFRIVFLYSLYIASISENLYPPSLKSSSTVNTLESSSTANTLESSSTANTLEI